MQKSCQGIVHLGVLLFLAVAVAILAVGAIFVFRGDVLPKKQTLPSRRHEIGNLFTIGSEDLKTCLKTALGKEVYQQIAEEKRGLDEGSASKVLLCFEKYGRRDSSPSQFVSPADLPDPAQLTRRYPSFVKCAAVAEPKALRLTFNLKKAKVVANTVCIYLSTPKFAPSMRSGYGENEKRILEIKWIIGKIKSEGLAVFLVQDLCCFDAEQVVTQGSSDEMLTEIEKEILMWAKVAEEYKVEYLTPFNEIDGKIDLFLEKEGLSQKDIIAKTNQWMASILPKLRKVFNGKLVAHYSELFPELDPTGYDYFGSTLDHYFLLDLDKFRQKTRQVYQLSLKLEADSKTKWLIPEAYFPWEEPQAAPDIQAMFKKRGKQLRKLQDDFFRISFEEILALPPEKRPAGFSPSGYQDPYSPPSLTELSRQEISKFFNQIN